eukprot:9439969-Pyramimonas_sp.AAC.1
MHFCGKLGVFNLVVLVFGLSQFDKIEGLKDLVPEPPMQQFISFTKQAVEWVTNKRSNSSMSLVVRCSILRSGGFLQQAHGWSGHASLLWGLVSSPSSSWLAERSWQGL